MAAFRSCLHQMSFVNKVYALVNARKDEVYSSSNATHEVQTSTEGQRLHRL